MYHHAGVGKSREEAVNLGNYAGSVLYIQNLDQVLHVWRDLLLHNEQRLFKFYLNHGKWLLWMQKQNISSRTVHTWNVQRHTLILNYTEWQTNENQK